MQLGLEGARVLVTGGAGGIGSACVRAFAAEGATVVVHYRASGDAAQALADEVGGVALGADLRDEAEVDALFAAAGPLDACVANAGVWPEDDVPVRDLPLERWRATLDANLTATFLTARGFLRGFPAADDPREDVVPGAGASLVLVASTAGHFGEAGHADYASAKAAIAFGLARSLKNEAAPVRVNVVSPGWTVSPMTAGTLDDATVARVTATMPLRKVATTDDIARAVVWLSSPLAAAHVTGQAVVVAGGMEGRILHPLG